MIDIKELFQLCIGNHALRNWPQTLIEVCLIIMTDNHVIWCAIFGYMPCILCKYFMSVIDSQHLHM